MRNVQLIIENLALNIRRKYEIPFTGARSPLDYCIQRPLWALSGEGPTAAISL